MRPCWEQEAQTPSEAAALSPAAPNGAPFIRGNPGGNKDREDGTDTGGLLQQIWKRSRGAEGFTLNMTQHLLSPRSKDPHTLSSSSCLNPASMGGTGRMPQAKNTHPTSDPLRRDIYLIASPDNSSHNIKMWGKKVNSGHLGQ